MGTQAEARVLCRAVEFCSGVSSKARRVSLYVAFTPFYGTILACKCTIYCEVISGMRVLENRLREIRIWMTFLDF